jgi:hypothetical protein
MLISGISGRCSRRIRSQKASRLTFSEALSSNAFRGRRGLQLITKNTSKTALIHADDMGLISRDFLV